uniref:Uncharacterized protein n=1 Tax=Heterorhabditis bacteriophora TaxID=37862 RepID=A0A1I7WD39_HETBA
MRQPVVQDKRLEHAQFCKEAKHLIENVTQRPISDHVPNPKDLTQVILRLLNSIILASLCSPLVF